VLVFVEYVTLSLQEVVEIRMVSSHVSLYLSLPSFMWSQTVIRGKDVVYNSSGNVWKAFLLSTVLRLLLIF
jgi:hypothetical protein